MGKGRPGSTDARLSTECALPVKPGVQHECPHFIPLASGELIDLLCADDSLPRDEADLFRALGERVALAFHLEYHRKLRALKAAYAPFDPDADTLSRVPLPAAERQRRLNGLLRDFAWLLDQAHFKHLNRHEMGPMLESASDWGIQMDVDFSAFEHIALFVRGEAYQTRTRWRWQNLWRQEEAEVPIYRRLVLIMKMRQHERLGPEADTEHVFLKVFKDIPRMDVDMLLPGARVRLTKVDRGKIVYPVVSGLALTVY